MHSSDLKRKIASIEWDIQNMDNEVVKKRKLETLKEYKLQLRNIQEENQDI